MFSKLSRSWNLVKVSAKVLRSDKELLLFPLLSASAAVLVIAGFVLPVAAVGGADGISDGETGPLFWAWALALYIALYFVMFFFNSALVGAALIRLAGGDPTVKDGLAIAASRIGPIFGYAVVAGTVGLALRAIEERLPLVGRLVVALIGAAWTVATFLTVPILVSRNVGPIDALRESVLLLKRSWGENLIGNVGIGLAFGLLWTAFILAGGGLVALAAAAGSDATAIAIAAVLVLGGILLALVQAALQGVYSAALYRYAAEGDAGGAFAAATMADAFRAKR